jgi:hypothetical protein
MIGKFCLSSYVYLSGSHFALAEDNGGRRVFYTTLFSFIPLCGSATISYFRLMCLFSTSISRLFKSSWTSPQEFM